MQIARYYTKTSEIKSIGYFCFLVEWRGDGSRESSTRRKKFYEFNFTPLTFPVSYGKLIGV